ncbi:hypothetical protein D3C72_1139750 [compost metagenome]
MADGVEVDFQNGFMGLFFQQGGNFFELENSCSFDQYGFVFKIQVFEIRDKIVCVFVGDDVFKTVGVSPDFFTHANNAVYFVGGNEF